MLGHVSFLCYTRPAEYCMLHIRSEFDALCDGAGVYKIETIGDAFMACAGTVSLVLQLLLPITAATNHPANHRRRFRLHGCAGAPTADSHHVLRVAAMGLQVYPSLALPLLSHAYCTLLPLL